MPELARFQDAFTSALAGDGAALAEWTAADDRFAVYRNTTAKGLVDALAAQFPTVAHVLGGERMAAAALAHARAHPPASPSLMAYGADFPDWLAGFAPAAEVPGLVPLARLDWARRDALFAPDPAPLGAGAFQALDAAAYAATAADLHASVSVLWFDEGAPSLWQALQADPPPAAAELGPEAEGILVLRPHLTVLSRRLDAGEFAFLDSCRQGASLAAAAEAALAADPALPLAGRFAELIALGAFACIRTAAPAVS
jgi:hypothetical protein